MVLRSIEETNRIFQKNFMILLFYRGNQKEKCVEIDRVSENSTYS